jgi:NTP pyrophosphatase (non-canonical NTP hydrolase)
MKLDDYQKQAMESIAIKDASIAALAHRILGLSGESGLIANRIKKIIRDSDGELSQADQQFIKEKLGDALYYISALADYADLSLSEVAVNNLEKANRFKLKSKQEREQGRNEIR